MPNIFTSSLTNVSQVGHPTVRQGTLRVTVPSIVNTSSVSIPSVGQINLSGHSIFSNRQMIGIPSIYATSTTNEVHSQVEYMVPGFIQDEHREFLDFMRAYYKFTEKADGPLAFLRRMLSVQDIDTTTTELIEYFYREFAPSFPRKTTISPATIIKNIKTFYLAKGSEKSFRFLFRVFFGDNVEFYYPRVDILRFSDAKWVQDKTIKCVRISGEPSKLIGNRIIGANSKASAFVEKVFLVQDGSITSHELFLNRSSIVGTFQADEVIKDEAQTCSLRVLPLVVKVHVVSKGKGYQVGHEVSVAGEGFNCKARISAVGPLGEVQNIQVYQFGAGYRPESTTIRFIAADGVTETAAAEPVFSTAATYPGYFLNSDGMLSNGKRIQDGYYYQQYSYVIKSEQSRDKYESIVEKLVHPAGFVFFSEVTTESLLDASSSIPEGYDDVPATDIEIYSDLDMTSAADLGGSLLAEGDPESVLEISCDNDTEDLTDISLGPTWEDWEVWKIDYRPTSAFGDRNIGMVQEGYYNLYANTPLKTFADVPLYQIVYNSKASIDHLPETDIYQDVE